MNRADSAARVAGTPYGSGGGVLRVASRHMSVMSSRGRAVPQ